MRERSPVIRGLVRNSAVCSPNGISIGLGPRPEETVFFSSWFKTLLEFLCISVTPFVLKGGEQQARGASLSSRQVSEGSWVVWVEERSERGRPPRETRAHPTVDLCRSPK